MKKTKKLNKFDTLVQELVKEFVKIPNFDLTSNDPHAQVLFNRITFRIAEMASYKELICQHFIPATNKAIFESKQDFLKSKYSFLLDANSLDFSETLYDTIRLAYVGVFHKLENYVNEVISLADTLFDKEDTSNETVLQWTNRKCKFNLKNWQRFSLIHRINWICNCVKHYDGYPVKEPKPIDFIGCEPSQRIKISPTTFKNDCDLVLKFYPIYFQQVATFASLKFAFETNQMNDYSDFPELQKLQENTSQELEKKLAEILTTMEELESRINL